jgi:hypothetical protein
VSGTRHNGRTNRGTGLVAQRTDRALLCSVISQIVALITAFAAKRSSTDAVDQPHASAEARTNEVRNPSREGSLTALPPRRGFAPDQSKAERSTETLGNVANARRPRTDASCV